MQEILDKAKELFKCDSARISQPSKRMFLIIGWNRNTKQDTQENGSYWEKNGEKCDFDYIKEETIANGNTKEELLESMLFYKQLQDSDGETGIKLLLEKYKAENLGQALKRIVDYEG